MRALFSCLFFLLMLQSNAQTPAPTIVYGGSHFTGMVLDGNDLWVCSRAGLLKKDVNTLVEQWFTPENSGLPIRKLNGIAKAPNGDLWLASDSGLIRKQGTVFTLFDPSNSMLPQYCILNVAVDDSNIVWCGYGIYIGSSTDGGLARYDGTNWQIYNETNSPLLPSTSTDILTDKFGKIWIAYNNSNLDEVLSFDGTSWVTYDSLNFNSYGWYSHKILTIDSSGNVYGLDYNHIVRFDNGTIPIVLYFTPAFQASSIYYDNSTNKFLMVYYGGINHDILSAYDSISSSIISTTAPIYDVTQIIKDQNGTIWITSDGALERFDGSNWYVYYDNFPPGLQFTCVLKDSNEIYVGRGWVDAIIGGLGKFDGTNWDVFTRYNSNLSDDDVQTIAKDTAHNIWIGTNAVYGTPLFIYDGVNFNPVTSYPDSNIVYKIVIGKNNVVWVLSDDANYSTLLYKYDGITWTRYDYSNIGADGFLGIGLDSSDVLWGLEYTSINSFALWEYNNGTWIQHIPPFSKPIFSTFYNVYENLTNSNNNSILIRTTEGLVKYDNGVWTDYTTANSTILGDSIIGTYVDHNENIYVDCWKYYPLPGSKSVFDGTNWTTIPYADWDFRKGVYDIQVYVDDSDNFYFTLTDELVIEHPSPLTSIKIPESKLDWNIYPNPATDKIVVDMDDKFSNEYKISIRTLLGQVISETSMVSKNNSISIDIQKLTPGIYFLGVEGEKIAETRKFVKY